MPVSGSMGVPDGLVNPWLFGAARTALGLVVGTIWFFYERKAALPDRQ